MLDKIQYLLIQAQITPDRLDIPKASFDATLPNVLRIAFQLSALLSVLFVAIGGIKYTTSNGDPQGIKKAKDTIMYALVGLVVSLSAAIIMSFVSARLQ